MVLFPAAHTVQSAGRIESNVRRVTRGTIVSPFASHSLRLVMLDHDFLGFTVLQTGTCSDNRGSPVLHNTCRVMPGTLFYLSSLHNLKLVMLDHVFLGFTTLLAAAC